LISTSGGLPGEKKRSLILSALFSMSPSNSGVEGRGGAAGVAVAAAAGDPAAGAAAVRATAGAAAAPVAGRATGRAVGATGLGAATLGNVGAATVGDNFGGRFVGEDINDIGQASARF
jgi:hypothetical protein